MTRMSALVVIGCVLGVVVVGGHLLSSRNLNAQSPKAKQKWEYAQLVFEDPIPPKRRSLAFWTTGKKTMRREGEAKEKVDPISMLNKDLGGKEETASVVHLFDRFGQDGWELVSHTQRAEPKRLIQTWTFKRAAQ